MATMTTVPALNVPTLPPVKAPVMLYGGVALAILIVAPGNWKMAALLPAALALMAEFTMA
jgi:hypothetical protein